MLNALQMSAFGGKADIDEPLLTNLALWVHGQRRHSHVQEQLDSVHPYIRLFDNRDVERRLCSER
jgi:hypothetical protein